MIEQLLQLTVNGLIVGTILALTGVGASLVFGIQRVANFAHGELMVVGMYLAWAAFEYFHVSPLLSLPVIAVLFF